MNPELKEYPHHPGVMVHESSYVDVPTEIGAGTRIWHFSHIMPNCSIGEGCNIGQNVVIGPDVTIGKNCKIQNNVSLYKGLTAGDDVFFGPSCVFTNVVNPRSGVERKSEFLTTEIGEGATIGANATIVCGNRIGRYAFIAAGAVVTKDVPAFALMTGVPARQTGWISRDGHRLTDALVCPETGEQYEATSEGGLTVKNMPENSA